MCGLRLYYSVDGSRNDIQFIGPVAVMVIKDADKQALFFRNE